MRHGLELLGDVVKVRVEAQQRACSSKYTLVVSMAVGRLGSKLQPYIVHHVRAMAVYRRGSPSRPASASYTVLLTMLYLLLTLVPHLVAVVRRAEDGDQLAW